MTILRKEICRLGARRGEGRGGTVGKPGQRIESVKRTAIRRLEAWETQDEVEGLQKPEGDVGPIC